MEQTSRSQVGGHSPVFDLSQASARSRMATRGLRRTALGVACFLALLGVIVVFTTSWRALLDGTLSVYQTFDTLVLLGIVIGGLLGSYWLVVYRTPSATAILVDETGFELIHYRTRHVSKLWSDPKLEFELIDFSDVNPSALSIPEFPYSIRVRGSESLLTRPAFEAISAQVRAHRLVELVVRGSSWRYPTETTPLIHRVSAAHDDRQAAA